MSTSTSVCEEQVVLILVGLVGSGKVGARLLQPKFHQFNWLCTSQLLLRLWRNIYQTSSADATKMIWAIEVGWKCSHDAVFVRVYPYASIVPISMQRQSETKKKYHPSNQS
jgi:hypothetical protein